MRIAAQKTPMGNQPQIRRQNVQKSRIGQNERTATGECRGEDVEKRLNAAILKGEIATTSTTILEKIKVPPIWLICDGTT